MKCQGELSIIGAYGGYSKTPAKHAPVVGNSVLNLLINILGSGSVELNTGSAILRALCALPRRELRPDALMLPRDVDPYSALPIATVLTEAMERDVRTVCLYHECIQRLESIAKFNDNSNRAFGYVNRTSADSRVHNTSVAADRMVMDSKREMFLVLDALIREMGIKVKR